MSNTFKKNDRVMVALGSKAYNGKFNGYFGTVVYDRSSHIGVAIDQNYNESSKYGCFWFMPTEIVPAFKDMEKYIENDITVTAEAAKAYLNSIYGVSKSNNPPAIKKVHFSGPMTVVIWEDGTKTLVKCSEDDFFDYEKGLAMAIVKKMYGNDNSFHKIFKKWIPDESTEDQVNERSKTLLKSLRQVFGIRSPSEDWLQNI